MNWIALRGDVKALLGDPNGGIYSDVHIDAAARIAYHRVRIQHPEPTTITAPTQAGDTSVTLPVDIQTIRSVDTGKRSIDPGTTHDMAWPRHTRAQLLYTYTPGQLDLSRAIHPEEAGTWTVRATRIPALPSGPTDAWELPDELEGAVLYFTAADLLKTRSHQTQRRGSKADFSHNQLITTYTREAERICRTYRRIARMT